MTRTGILGRKAKAAVHYAEEAEIEVNPELPREGNSRPCATRQKPRAEALAILCRPCRDSGSIYEGTQR